jgi:uncharacterized protein
MDMDQMRRRALWGLAFSILAALAVRSTEAAPQDIKPIVPKERPAARAPKAPPAKPQAKPQAKAAPPAEDAPYIAEKVRTNAGTVSIMVSSLNCTCMRFAEDIRNVVNDLRPNGHRALIAIGEGGPQQLKDITFLPGMHMAIVDEADLKRLEASDPAVFADAQQKFRYITKLYNAELHILARSDIASVAALKGKAINVEGAGSQSDTVAARIFGVLGIDYTATHYDEGLALEKLLSGELAAIVLSTGAPQDSLQRLRPGDGVHFLALDEASLPGADLTKIQMEFLPAELTADDYPGLIAAGETVPTVASRMILAIYNWPEKGEHYNRNALFTAAFFSKIEQFQDPSRHPKWKDVNLAADVPGWTRFKPAQAWLDAHKAVATAAEPPSARFASEKAAFESFVATRSAASGEPLDPAEVEALYKQFQAFIAARKAQPVAAPRRPKASGARASNAAPKTERPR